MKFFREEKEVYELKEWHKKLIKNDIPEEIFEADMKRRAEYFTDRPVSWVFEEKIKGCLRRMHAEYDPILKDRAIDIPKDDESFVGVVVSQLDYKDRSRKDADDKILRKGLGL